MYRFALWAGWFEKREDDLLSIEGLGQKGLQDIKRALSNLGANSALTIEFVYSISYLVSCIQYEIQNTKYQIPKYEAPQENADIRPRKGQRVALLRSLARSLFPFRKDNYNCSPRKGAASIRGTAYFG